MTTCPKCGFINKQSQATDCPKCGLIYAKFKKVQEEESQHISAERSLNNSLNKAISSSFDEPSSYTDFEADRDSRTYPMVDNLSLFFIVFAGILAIFTIFEIKYVWNLLFELNASFKIFSKTDVWIIVLSIGFLGIMQTAIYLAVGGLLHLGKDIADNTRATRNYLSHIAKKMK